MPEHLTEFEQAYIAAFTSHLQANPNKRFTLYDIEHFKSLLNSMKRSGMIPAGAYNHLIEFLNAFPTWSDMPEDEVDLAVGMFKNGENSDDGSRSDELS